jgi:uncharacterized protein YjbI with pentapeptide repeats
VWRAENRPSEFLDARLGELDLRHTVIEGPSNRPVDLRHANVAGDLRLSHATVRQRLRLDSAHVGGTFDCKRTRFEDVLSAEGATFDQTVSFEDTEFRRSVYLSDATLRGTCRWVDADFEGGVWCNRATFGLLKAYVVTAGDRADFSETTIDEAQFARATFHDRALFHDTTFGVAAFGGVRFHDTARFDGARFPERVSFVDAAAARRLSVTDARTPATGTTVRLRGAHVAGGRLHPADADGGGDDGSCDTDSGSSAAPLVYDLTGATIGEVSLGEDADLDHYRFLDTTFEGFDFAAYRDRLAAVDWRLHEVEWPPHESDDGRDGTNGGDGGDAEKTEDHGDTDDTAPPPGKIESTFLKAKNGANDVGDTTAAAEFFRREMRARRWTHGRQVRRGGGVDRVVAAGRWVGNALLWAVAGYGERPSRVVTTAVVVVLLCTVGFWLSLDTPPHGSSVGYLVVSLESFLTLVLAGGAPVPNPWVRLFALVEGFTGAFLVALFVFTLTRSIHR